MQYRVTMVVRDKVSLPSISLFHCLPGSAWAAAKWVEVAMQDWNFKNKVIKTKSLATGSPCISMC